MLRLTLFKDRLNLVKELKLTTDGGRLFQTGTTRCTKNSYGNCYIQCSCITLYR